MVLARKLSEFKLLYCAFMTNRIPAIFVKMKLYICHPNSYNAGNIPLTYEMFIINTSLHCIMPQNISLQLLYILDVIILCRDLIPGFIVKLSVIISNYSAWVL